MPLLRCLLFGLDAPMTTLDFAALAEPGDARQGHQREVDAVEVVAQVENARKTGPRELLFVPPAVVALRVEQEFHSRIHGGRFDFAGGAQPQNGPGGLRSRRRSLPAQARVVVAAGRFTPASA